MPNPPPSPVPPAAPAPRAGSWWQGFKADAVHVFHVYANWLVGISWTRFVLLSILLLIAAEVLADVSQSSPSSSEEVTIAPADPAAPSGKETPLVTIEKSRGDHGAVTISIDKDGVRITPRAGTGATKPAAAASAASAAASAAAPPAFAASVGDDGVEIRLPPGADSEAVREAVKEARAAVVDAIHESEQEAAERARETAEQARESADASRKAVRTIKRIRAERSKPPLPELAWLFIVASAILKISYKGTIQAEVKAAEATETAESEQLKRQVVEARMAAMQAQVEPHFLFNTLASIDHLIETDPARASQMQKNLIALLRASMPSMRDANPAAHNLGREMAVIRPYLEILKVRMEDRLQTRIDVPDGLLSAEFPSMMIQSLVENAIKHGLEPKAEGGTLDVTAEIVHGNLAVTVADTGLGFGRAATAGTGIGLANIRERLKLLYGDRASMVVADNSPSGTVVTLTVPYQAQVREGAVA
jgi:histidine kinase/histidine kinase/DNA gyrase B/HSP90-like ATPase